MQDTLPEAAWRGDSCFWVSLNGGKPLRLILDSGADGIFVSGPQACSANLERLVSDHIAGLGAVGDSGGYPHGVSPPRRDWRDWLEDCLVHVKAGMQLPLNADGAIGLNVFEKFYGAFRPCFKETGPRPLCGGFRALVYFQSRRALIPGESFPAGECCDRWPARPVFPCLIPEPLSVRHRERPIGELPRAREWTFAEPQAESTAPSVPCR